MPDKPRRPAGKTSKATKSTKSAKASTAAKSARPKKSAPAASGRPSPGRKASTTRTARLESARRKRRQRSLGLRVALGVFVVVVVGAPLYSWTSSKNEDKGLVSRLEASPGNCAHDTKADRIDPGQKTHIDNPTFTVDPPAGGPHDPAAAEPGFYKEDKPDDGKLVHAMEHGFIVLWYRPDLGEADRQKLSALSDQFGRELIIVPRTPLPGQVSVTAWHQRLQCDTLDPAVVGLFTDSYKDQGPEKGYL